jgi:galactokinase
VTDAPLAAEFRDRFGRAPEITVRSPGRVNLIGDHTDYHEGFVLPAAIDLGTDVVASRRDDGHLRVVAARLNESDDVRLIDLSHADGPAWTAYVRGCARLLRQSGRDIPSADVLIDGDLPIGGGLSSSASLELGVSVALLSLAGAEVDRVALARLCQRVENEVVGVQSGIMDQLAVACGVQDHALMIDCRATTVEPVAIPGSVRILVLDSGIPRTLAGSAFNERRAESAAALEVLRNDGPDLMAIRDVTPELLARHQDRLDDVGLRRIRHVVTENERVRQSATALRDGDMETFGRLMAESHASLRDDYEVSVPDLDTLVATALHTPGVYGARLTGAGFGGCAVALVDADRAESAAADIGQRYGDLTGRTCTALLCRASRGTHVL